MTGHELRDFRTFLGLTQYQFAARVGFRRSVIAYYEARNSLVPEVRERLIRMEFNMPAKRLPVKDTQTGDLFVEDNKPQ